MILQLIIRGDKMETCLKKLMPDMYNEFLHYFDHDAFSDHEEWSSCYCLESHLKKAESERYSEKEKRRKKAKDLIQQGIMNGYLIYDKCNVVGWCNAGDKRDYEPICENEAFLTGNNERGKIKVLYCIDIAPNYRGKGIANIVIEKVLADAKEEGYSYVEGYPFSDESFSYQYRGPFKLYEKYGFQLYRKEEWFYIMRKEL